MSTEKGEIEVIVHETTEVDPEFNKEVKGKAKSIIGNAHALVMKEVSASSRCSTLHHPQRLLRVISIPS